jgi:RNA polymerase sigma-70 factor, ECF subfamily
MDDASLIKRLQLNDEAAFKQLVDDYQHKIFNICYGYLHNAEEAEDVAQEVFIQVYKAVNKFRGESKISTWLYRIAVNRSLNKIRSRKSKWVIALETILEGDKVYDGTAGETPYDSLENKERAQVLHEAIDKLSENQKTAFVLSKYRGLANKSIAKIMDLSLSAVEALMNRAKKNLQKNLREYYNNQ